MLRYIARLGALSASVAFVGLVFAPSAFAYIDPGSGSYIIQILIASFLAVSVAVATFWKRLRLFFGKLLKRRR